MNPSRGVGRAAWAARAGTMASRKGSASVAPVPRRNVLRESAFLVMNTAVPPLLLHESHLKRSALHDAEHQRRQRVFVARGATGYLAHRWSIIVLQIPP